MKKTIITLTLLSCASVSNAATLFFQDFSASSASSSINGVLSADTFYAANSSDTITGGSSAAQATNGDYTIEINSNGGSGYALNQATDAGFNNLDTAFSLETGNISFVNNGVTYDGTIFVNASIFNVGSEYLSINSITVTQDDVTQEVTLDFNFNAFGDWDPSTGNEDIALTTDFGAGGDVTGFDLAAAEGFTSNNQIIPNLTYSLILAPAVVPEPSSVSFLSLAGVALLLRRRRA